jgi:hypothetical protein
MTKVMDFFSRIIEIAVIANIYFLKNQIAAILHFIGFSF